MFPEPRRRARPARTTKGPLDTWTPERAGWTVLLLEEDGAEFMRLREGLTEAQARALEADPRPFIDILAEADRLKEIAS